MSTNNKCRWSNPPTTPLLRAWYYACCMYDGGSRSVVMSLINVSLSLNSVRNIPRKTKIPASP